MTAKDDLITAESDDCAARLKALSDPTRLAVLRHLATGSSNVTDLMTAFGVAQNLMSHHLRVLREAELVICRREGKCMMYHLADGVLGRGAKSLKLGCCDINFRT
ncbi:MAG: winged helix-turn-helix transcriptional regulator [Planctomycetes bacterium]|nr:winged helix-turn-helix transcriptional regulator [Planctomycetota bacterium]